MITTDGINLISSSILELISHGEILIGEEIKRIEIYKTTIEKNYIKVYLLLDDTLVGKITNIKLISKSGVGLMDKAEVLQKTNTKGLLIIFSLRISEVVT